MVRTEPVREGTAEWFKARKRELLVHIRALDDFSNVHALATRLVENVGEEIDDTEQLRGALFMSAVVTYVRPFLKSKNKYGETSGTYPIRRLKDDARFDAKLHEHLLHVRNKLIAHDDGKQLPPTLHVLSIAVDQDPSSGRKPTLATARSYSLSSAKGPRFHAALQKHSEACVEGVKRALHAGIMEYLTEAQVHHEAFEASNEYQKGPSQKEISLQFNVQGPISTRLFALDELTEKTISVPEGNMHNKAYTYRMVTYSGALPSVHFLTEGNEVEFYVGTPKPLQPKKTRASWKLSWVRKLIDWGNKPV